MRNKSKAKTIIFTLGIVFVFLSINNYNFFNQQDGTMENRDKTNFKKLKKSDYWSTNFIHVDGNWSHTVGNYSWCSGDGSWGNPYLIENVTVNASNSPTGSGIIIENSKNEYFVIRNCTIFNAGNGTYDGGIKLENTNNGILSNNNCSNNGRYGIFLYIHCDNNTISGNIATHNTYHGIYLNNQCDNNTISENTANDNEQYGIYLNNLCINNNISGNTVSYNTIDGIVMYNDCDYNTILGNIANNNIGYGIRVHELCEYNTVSGNTANNNGIYGIILNHWCHENTITGNTANNNSIGGIRIYNTCYTNIISGNTANDNIENGINLREICMGNIISGNNITNNGNRGISLRWVCDDNIITGNNINNSTYGIYLFDNCADNFILNNSINNNSYGIYLDSWCGHTISGNDIHYNNQYGVFIGSSCNFILIYLNYFIGNGIHTRDAGTNQWDNGIIGNYWDDYGGVDANDDGIGDTPYDVPPAGGGVDNNPIWDDGPHVIIINSPNPGDGFGLTAPNFNVSINFPILNASWYTLDNGITNYTFIGSSGTINQTAWDACEEGPISIKFYVNNTVGNFSSAEITVIKDTIPPVIEINSPIHNFIFGEYAPVYDLSINEENLVRTWYTIDGGITNTTFTELTGIINQTLWEALSNGYVTIRFYAIDIVSHVEFEDVIVLKDAPENLLYVDIIDQTFTSTEFIVKFIVQNEIGQGIINATIQMWWNGVDVSDNVNNLGNGFYDVSLEPVTVIPGEDPILLNMTISASGYQDKYFETHIAVDPDALEKDGETPGGKFPLTIIIIAITSIVGAIGVAGVSLFLLRRRKRAIEGK